MKKHARHALGLLVAAALLAGCAPAGRSGPDAAPIFTIPEDYVCIPAENHYLMDYSWNSVYADLSVYAAFPIQEFTLETPPESGIRATEYYLVEDPNWEQPRTLPFYLYQAYRGKAWSEYAELQRQYLDTNYSSAAEAALLAAQNEYLEDYTALEAAGELPALYEYNLSVRLEPKVGASGTVTCDRLDVTINGTPYSFPIGGVAIDTETPFPAASLQDRPAVMLLVIPNARSVSFNEDGVFLLAERTSWDILAAQKDAEILNLQLSFDTPYSVESIRAKVLNSATGSLDEVTGNEYFDGEWLDAADFYWDAQSPIRLSQGQVLELYITAHDQRLAGKLYGMVNQPAELSYRDADGQVWKVYMDLGVKLYPASPFEVYLARETETDVAAYYTDYYFPLSDSENDYGIYLIEEVE